MRRDKGFTLLELLMVVTIILAISGSFYISFEMLYRERAAAQGLADARMQARGAAWKILGRLAASESYTLSQDNHAVLYADGSRVVWREQALWWEREGRATPLTSLAVLDFAAVERNGRLTLTMVLRADSYGEREQTYRSSWSNP